MTTATIRDITQEEFDEAAQVIISGLKSSDPKLDTRLGTVLRSLLVNPEARIEAVTSKQIDNVRKASSLKTLKETNALGEEIDVNDVNAIMSNFNIRSSAGTYSEGLVKITVSDGLQTYAVPAGVEFSTSDGLIYSSISAVNASLDGKETNSILYKGFASYFFLVPVRANEVGIKYNIPRGTSLSINSSIYGFVAAEAYKSFDGGSDISNIDDIVDRIPSGLSIRGFVNKNACEGMLRDNFDSGNHPIVDCSTVGYGSDVQRRDKHNLFGVGVGGRIDLYVRNFNDPYTITKTVTGTKTADGEYDIHLSVNDFPGAYWVKYVGDINTDVTSPLEFSCKRTSEGVDSTWHDFDIRRNTSETFNTVWGGIDIHTVEVPPDIGVSTSSLSDDEWSDERPFQVTVYCLPEAKELQEYVDRDDVRSVSTDVVVRCPIICNVTVSATVIYDPDNPIDANEAKFKIRKYINGLGFVGALTRSEIVHILKSCGAVSVDLNQKNMLYGTLHDSYGKEYNLSGDALKFEGLADGDSMLSSETAVFAIEPENIQLILIPNE